MKFKEHDLIVGNWGKEDTDIQIIAVIGVHCAIEGRAEGYSTMPISRRTEPITYTHNAEYIETHYELASEELKNLARLLLL